MQGSGADSQFFLSWFYLFLFKLFISTVVDVFWTSLSNGNLLLKQCVKDLEKWRMFWFLLLLCFFTFLVICLLKHTFFCWRVIYYICCLIMFQVAMATGQVLFQRFYYSKSFVRHPMETTAMGCLYLASKIEEAPRRIRDVINVFHHIRQVKSQKWVLFCTFY